MNPALPIVRTRAARPRVARRVGAALLLATGLATAFAAPPKKAKAPEPVPYAHREAVRIWAAEVAQRQGLDPAWVDAAIAASRHVPAAVRLIQPPPAGTAKNWAAYRARFIEPVRIRAGVAFWREHEALLSRAEAQYGVPAEIVVGILGVETLYGRHMGDFRVLDALTTLGFDFPAGRRDRSAFFRDELEQFLVLAQREQSSPTAFKGSYAGAMGLPQFMPSSWLKHAVDFDGDGRIDLQGSPADAIGSVANYLAAYGWRRGEPTHFSVAVPVAVSDRAVLLAPDILPSFTAAQFTERGASLEAAGRDYAGPLALVELQNGPAAPSYVAGTRNFYAVTRYNWSSYYAMAVIDLGSTVAEVRRATQ